MSEQNGSNGLDVDKMCYINIIKNLMIKIIGVSDDSQWILNIPRHWKRRGGRCECGGAASA